MDVKKNLLIIKSHAQSLGPAESFLLNRDWNIKSTSDPKEALAYLVQNQPEFVMISIDHPNKKVRNLPKVLSQALPICVIAFAESSTSASIKKLSECSGNYAIFHPVTGPAVERMVHKYQKDLQSNPSALARRGEWTQNKDTSGVIAIKGSSEADEATKNLLASLMAVDAGTMTSGDSDLFNNTESGPASNTHGEWIPIEKNSAPSEMFSDDGIEVSKDHTSLILQGTRDAMEKACLQNPALQTHEIEKTSNAVCIFVESSRFSGYLIAVMAKDRAMDKTFVDTIRSRLFDFLRENGERIEDNESLTIKLKQVPFMAWALEYADFLRKSVHEGHEVALAFFPRNDLKVKVLESKDHEMAAIEIQELVPDVQVEFNLYLHFPLNNRYVLYTPCGGVFFGFQKERLVSQGVSHLHILRIELSGFDKYRAQNFLNDKIEEFAAKTQEKVTI